MKINYKIEQLGTLSPSQFLRRAAYVPLPERFNNQVSFVRRLGRDFYPRFHIYLEKQGNDLYFNIHLDQKKASYQGQTAHSGEYDGQLVEIEGKRLLSLLLQEEKNIKSFESTATTVRAGNNSDQANNNDNNSNNNRQICKKIRNIWRSWFGF